MIIQFLIVFCVLVASLIFILIVKFNPRITTEKQGVKVNYYLEYFIKGLDNNKLHDKIKLFTINKNFK